MSAEPGLIRRYVRHVPPAHSPVPSSALWAGIRFLAAGDDGPRRRVTALVARHFGAEKVLFTDSGTSALMLALSGAATRRGSVALPAYACYDLLTAAHGAGIKPLLYDVDPVTLSADGSSLRRVLHEGAEVVVAAHLYGVPVDLDAVRTLSEQVGALLVEDAAQGVGATYRGRPLGGHGSLSVLSFGRGKGLTGGGGGALLANDARGEAILATVEDAAGPPPGRGAAGVASAAAQRMFSPPWLYGLPARLPILSLGESVYRPPRPPRLAPGACIAVLEESWSASLQEARGRRTRAARLMRTIRSADDVRGIESAEHGTPGYLRLPIMARGETARERLSGPAAERLGVMPGYPRPLHGLDEYRSGRDDAREVHPGAEAMASSLYTLPVHSRLSSADLDQIEELIPAR